MEINLEQLKLDLKNESDETKRLRKEKIENHRGRTLGEDCNKKLNAYWR